MEEKDLENVFSGLSDIMNTLGRVDFKDITVALVGLLMKKGQWKDFREFKEQFGITLSDSNFRKVMKSVASLKWAKRVNVYTDKKGQKKNDPTKGHWVMTAAGKEAGEVFLEFLDKVAILIRNQREEENPIPDKLRAS